MSTSSLSKAQKRKDTLHGYLFLLPSLIFFIGFVVIPMVYCVYISFFDSNLNATTSDVFIGLDNYKELFQDEVFIKALQNTMIIVLVSVPVVTIFSLWVSSVIFKLKNWALSFFRCIFYLPVVTGSVAVTVVWKWMYNNYYGIFYYALKSTGIIHENINWLGDPRFALGCIILILLTTSVGQPIVLYVSALNNVDQGLIEAAKVDGATDRQTGILEDQMAFYHAYYSVYTGHYDDQQFPMLRIDPIINIRRTELFHRDSYVLHLLHGI